MGKSKPWVNEAKKILREKPKRKPLPKKALQHAYMWLLFGGLYFGCHRRYLGQGKEANRLVFLFLLVAVLSVISQEYHPQWSLSLSPKKREFLGLLVFTPVLFIYLREFFIIPPLFKDVNKRIESYNTYWFKT
ncbi:MAG: hypothetical protein ACSHXY_00795 [Alphaproteobacteria bacterium]